MSNNTAFQTRWNRCVDNFEVATGDRKVAEVITLSLITGQPLLVVSDQPQEALAACIANSFGGVTGVFSSPRADVRLIDDLEVGQGQLLERLADELAKPTDTVSLVIGRISPDSTTVHGAILDRFGLSIRFDNMAGAAQGHFVSRSEILEMRHAAAVTVDQELTKFIAEARRRCSPECWEGGVSEFIACGPSVRASIRLLEMVRLLALANGREATRDDIKGLFQPVMMHRFEVEANSPYDRFAVGTSLVASLAAVLI